MIFLILSSITLITCLYYLFNLILWISLDCDIELFIKSKFGKKISSLSGKVVWITGASSGIGQSLAHTLATHGVKLVLTARRVAELEKVKEQCLTFSGGKLKEKDILTMQMDMLQLERHEEFFGRVIEHFGTLDILVNNAGRSQRAAWQDIDLSVDRALFDLDVFSAINLSRIAVRYFLDKGINGHIAVNSSIAGLMAIPNSATYVAAKHAINGYMHALKLEHPYIKTTIFCAGPTFSEFLHEAFTNKIGEKYGQSVKSSDKRLTAERCAELFSVALANGTNLNWAGCFPFSFLLYLKYYPNLYNFVIQLMGSKTLYKIRDSK
ncbi:dehydrogenase/reductase SDR family member 7-like [Lutzomyia longipalpis]|uniref:dehydrogenase/reductase SDR family member 7-like n=1 Tax=Lutzomyia longipalpis TaxID=7200 RepID=UPI0024841154|nr:dehydrogenase/reductase SDR family member 7-like [Lutzomyia longipalpis]